ncbi:Uma2 family endonuclease [Cyanobacterium stanieri LEGE 03274]|uniref:Uma2 family endonuclease n=1 Tax=Cyanobacterium stanieri LEGE 03274 TaxID=1828756 RepID=A0ABR9V3X2_9CHRO|nr:Uma2 family endonuclease [Cyanobacterium stanieri]MBE9222249.1 Uma2 family endonuclease [Cyanobacterium stanieri LEGE 03274]
MNAYTINFDSIFTITDKQFYQLCTNNPELVLERNRKGELIIMSPTGGETGKKNAELNADFVIWNRQKKLGYIFDSSTCFRLPMGSNRSPDVAYIKKERWDKLTEEEKIKFPPIAPDFVLELMSNTDSLKMLQEKMAEYMESGVKLGWLINPDKKEVEIYRRGKEKEILSNPQNLSGENVLPDFILDLTEIF